MVQELETIAINEEPKIITNIEGTMQNEKGFSRRTFLKGTIYGSLLFLANCAGLDLSSGKPQYIPKEKWVPKEDAKFYWMDRPEPGGQARLRLLRLSQFITPEDPSVQAELKKVKWKDYGYDEKMNQVLSIANHLKKNSRSIIEGTDIFYLPREIIERYQRTGTMELDCKAEAVVVISMINAKGIDEEENFFLAGGYRYKPQEYSSAKERKKHHHLEVQWERPDVRIPGLNRIPRYRIPTLNTNPLSSLHLDILTDNFFPGELANRFSSYLIKYYRSA